MLPFLIPQCRSRQAPELLFFCLESRSRNSCRPSATITTTTIVLLCTSTSCKPNATITTTTSTTSCRPPATFTTTTVALLLLLVVDHLVDNCVLLFLVARLGQQVVQSVVHHLLGHSHLSSRRSDINY